MAVGRSLRISDNYAMLTFLAAIYGKVTELRNRLYDRGVLDTFDLGAATVSIGNLTTGGTGKTPLVAYVAEMLASRGETVCILTRGYGRKDAKRRVLVSDGEQILADVSTAGDEPIELARKLSGKIVIIADADRVSAAEWAKRKFGVTAFVLDDGFQHRRAVRDIDIVCVDATNPFGGRRMLPAGRLRESVDGLARADIVVITRANIVAQTRTLRDEIAALAPNAEIFESSNNVVGYRLVNDSSPKPTDPLDVRHVFAFCGIGNPENFFLHLRNEHINLAGTKTFADHYVYSKTDISVIEAEASRAHADLLLTTAKDGVKLSEMKFTLPCLVVETDIGLDDPERFAALI